MPPPPPPTLKIKFIFFVLWVEPLYIIFQGGGGGGCLSPLNPPGSASAIHRPRCSKHLMSFANVVAALFYQRSTDSVVSCKRENILDIFCTRKSLDYLILSWFLFFLFSWGGNE